MRTFYYVLLIVLTVICTGCNGADRLTRVIDDWVTSDCSTMRVDNWRDFLGKRSAAELEILAQKGFDFTQEIDRFQIEQRESHMRLIDATDRWALPAAVHCCITPPNDCQKLPQEEQVQQEQVKLSEGQAKLMVLLKYGCTAPDQLVSALHVATEAGCIPLMDLLLKQGKAPVNGKGYYDKTALHIAAGHRDIEALGCLLRNGADVHSCDYTGSTPFHSAINYPADGGDTLAVLEILQQAGAMPNTIDKNGRTPLQDAIGNSTDGVVQWLLGAGANVRVNGGVLQEALIVFHYKPGMLALLLKQMGINEFGVAAEFVKKLCTDVRKENASERVQELMNLGVKLPYAVSEKPYERSLLHLVVSKRDIPMARALATTDTVRLGENQLGGTALHQLCDAHDEHNDARALGEILVNAGADVTAHDDQKRTPLQILLQRGVNLKLADDLASKGAEIFIPGLLVHLARHLQVDSIYWLIGRMQAQDATRLAATMRAKDLLTGNNVLHALLENEAMGEGEATKVRKIYQKLKEVGADCLQKELNRSGCTPSQWHTMKRFGI